MKKFSKILENKDLSYTDFFNKKIDHKEAFLKYLKSGLYEIIMDEENISEKSFSETDEVIEKVDKKLIHIDLLKYEKMYNQGKRLQYICEIIFDEHFKN